MKIFVSGGVVDVYHNTIKETCVTLLEKIYLNDNELLIKENTSSLVKEAYEMAKLNNSDIVAINKKVVVYSQKEKREDLIKNSDCLLFLPGGIKTINDFFIAFEMKVNNEIDKPIILFNCNGFYDDLVTMIFKSVKFGYVTKEDLDLLEIVDNHQDILDLLL